MNTIYQVHIYGQDGLWKCPFKLYQDKTQASESSIRLNNLKNKLNYVIQEYPKHIRLRMHPKCVGEVLYMIDPHTVYVKWQWGSSLYNKIPITSLELSKQPSK